REAEADVAQLGILMPEGMLADRGTQEAQQRAQPLQRLTRLVHGNLLAFLAQLGLRTLDLLERNALEAFVECLTELEAKGHANSAPLLCGSAVSVQMRTLI